MPDVPAPEDCPAAEYGVVFPDTEVRTIDAPSVGPEGGSATIRFWARGTSSYDSAAANQAIVAWGQPGFIIGAALRPHSDVVDVREAHRTISTGVISHTAHFHEPADVGDWLLYTNEAAYAGHGRVFGTGSVFTRAGELVSTFAQDSIVGSRARSTSRPACDPQGSLPRGWLVRGAVESTVDAAAHQISKMFTHTLGLREEVDGDSQ